MSYIAWRIEYEEAWEEEIACLLETVDYIGAETVDARMYEDFLSHKKEWELVDAQLQEQFPSEGIVQILYFEPEQKQSIDCLYHAFQKLREQGASIRWEDPHAEENEEADRWQEYFQPHAVGERFWIAPPWAMDACVRSLQSDSENSGDVEKMVLCIDPGMAFGTGEHETTQLCLETLDAIHPRGTTVLDMGCGSGILAIAAKKLGAAIVEGVDIDPRALENAAHNAQLNKVDICFYESDLFSACEKKYDIVCANLLLPLVLRLLTQVDAYVQPGGHLLLSGLLKEQAEEVRRALPPHFQWKTMRMQGDWVMIHLEKENA